MERPTLFARLTRFFSHNWLILLYFAAAFSWLKGNSILLFCLTVSIVCIWLAYRYRQFLALIVRSKVTIFLYSVVILFIAKTYAEKLLNHQFGIQPDYIKNASIVYGAFLSVPLTIAVVAFILMMAFIAVYIMTIFDVLLLRSLNEFHRHELWQSWVYLITACVMVLMPMGSIQDKMARAALLTDAYPVSRCGPERHNILYLQKSETACLTLDFHFNSRQIIYDIKPSELPSGDQPGTNHQ